MEAFLGEILANIATVQYWITLVVGVCSGLILGAIPGVSATMAVALIVPFTFGMGIVQSISLLIGLFFGTIYGGSIPAILFKTPGTPASAATIFDGYTMMKKGETGRALSIAAVSMIVGALIGTAVLVFFAPYISVVALKFGPAELFAMASFGIIVIVSVSDTSLLKGILSALAGLLLSCIGMEQMSGYPRYIFGMTGLMEGLPFIPVLIGLFAVSGALLMNRETSAKSEVVDVGFCELPSKKDFKHSFPTMLKSGILGALIGSAPGAGCDIAAFVSYAVSKHGAKKDDKFGDGEPKGIAAVESAKSACTSGALIPLLSLGIPGDAVTAILVGAFILHGIQPGPLLFENHAPLVSTIFATVLFAHILVFVTALLSVKWSTLILKLDQRYIKGGVLLLSIVGSFALRNNLADVWIAFIFGIIGVVMQKWKFPVAPFLLALILGQMAEVNFRRAMMLQEDSLTFIFHTPIALSILSVAVLFFMFSLVKRLRRRQK